MPTSRNPPPAKKIAWAAMAGLVALPVVAVLVVALGFGTFGSKKEGQEGSSEGVTQSVASVVPTEFRPRAPKSERARASRDEPSEDVPERTDDPASRAAAKIEEARRVDNTDPKLSRQLLREALEADPNNVTALQRLGAKMLIDENHAEAKDLADRCLRVSGADPTCAKINEYVVAGPDLEKNRRDAQSCLGNSPANPICLYIMLNHHLSRGEVEDAAVFAGRLTQVDPSSMFTQSAQGRIKGASGNYAAARSFFDAACRQNDPQGCFRAELLRTEGW